MNKLFTNFCFEKMTVRNDHLFTGRWGHSTICFNNYLYIFGGFDGYNYHNDIIQLNLMNSIMNERTTSGIQPLVRSNHTALLYKDKMIVYGGTGDGICHTDLFSLDLTTFKWEILDEYGPNIGSYHSGDLLNNYLIIFGGQTGELINNHLFVYDLINKLWFEVNLSKIKPRIFHSMCIINDQLIIFSGSICCELTKSIGDLVVVDMKRAMSEKIFNKENIY